MLKYTLPVSLGALVIFVVALAKNPSISENSNHGLQSSVKQSPLVSNTAPKGDKKTYLQTLLSKGLTKQEAQLLVFYKIKQTKNIKQINRFEKTKLTLILTLKIIYLSVVYSCFSTDIFNSVLLNLVAECFAHES